MLLVVNFHYVSRDPVGGPRAIFPIAVSDLLAQVEDLGRHFEFVDRDAVERAVGGGRPLPERACLLTFDDGLLQQAELALPALLERGIVPLFLVPGQPIAEGRALYVHKVHHIRDTLEVAELEALLEAPLARLGSSTAEVSDELAFAAYAYDEPEQARLKFLLNRVLPFGERERVVDEIFAQVVDDERDFCRRLYMPGTLLAELEREHHAVGAHSYGHKPLALLGAGELREDVEASASVLERATGIRPRTISYPHGSVEAVDGAVAAAAAATGFQVGFTMERSLNRTLRDPLLLARVDANDAPGGSRPLLAFDETGRPVVSGRMTEARRRYGDELARARA